MTTQQTWTKGLSTAGATAMVASVLGVSHDIAARLVAGARRNGTYREAKVEVRWIVPGAYYNVKS